MVTQKPPTTSAIPDPEDESNIVPTPSWLPEQAEQRTAPKYDMATRMNLQTFEDAIRLGMEHGIVVSSEEMGDGFMPIPDVDMLIGLPFVIVDWHYGKNKKYGTDFIIIRLITKHNEKYMMIEGSTGIMRQLQMYEQLAEQKIGTYRCMKGLSKSEYFYSTELKQVVPETYISQYDGDKIQAATYYIVEG